jgi:hypothetical protein
MAHVRVEVESEVLPETFLGALTDFSHRRPELWPNLDRRTFAVHSLGPAAAEVTEGSRGVWERTRYDWSEPGSVRIEVQDSNAFRPGSWWLYTAEPGAHGGSRVRVEFDRRPRNLRGLLLGALLTVAGERIFGAFLRETLQRLERRGAAAPGRLRARPT